MDHDAGRARSAGPPRELQAQPRPQSRHGTERGGDSRLATVRRHGLGPSRPGVRLADRDRPARAGRRRAGAGAAADAGRRFSGDGRAGHIRVRHRLAAQRELLPVRVFAQRRRARDLPARCVREPGVALSRSGDRLSGAGACEAAAGSARDPGRQRTGAADRAAHLPHRR